jgi:hypothetical protein
MPGITLAQAQILLDAAITAYQETLGSQEYTRGGRSLKRAELASLSADIDKWSTVVKKLDRGGISVRWATPT